MEANVQEESVLVTPSFHDVEIQTANQSDGDNTPLSEIRGNQSNHQNSTYNNSSNNFQQVLFHDHSSLSSPTDTLLFQKKVIRIYGLPDNGQFVLEHSIDNVAESNHHGSDALRKRDVDQFKQEQQQDNHEQQSKQQHTILAKQSLEMTPGLFFLRLLSTLTSALLLSFIFVAGVQFLLYLVLGLALDIGKIRIRNSGQRSASETLKLLSGLCSIPNFATGLSFVNSLYLVFVKDTWYGLELVKSVLMGGGEGMQEMLDQQRKIHLRRGNSQRDQSSTGSAVAGNSVASDATDTYHGDHEDTIGQIHKRQNQRQKAVVAVEWVSFLVFIGIPTFVLCCSLLSGSDYFWSITALTWIWLVFSCSILFGIIVIYFQISVSLEMITFLPNVYLSTSIIGKWKQIILLSKRHDLSGRLTETYVDVHGGGGGKVEAGEGREENEKFRTMNRDTIKEMSIYRHTSLYSKLTTKLPNFMFHTHPQPKLTYNTNNDKGQITPYATLHRWDLHKSFCRNPHRRHIAIVNGPGSIHISQVRSTLACATIGACLEVLLLLSVLVWLDTTALLIVVLVLMLAWAFVPTVRRLVTISKTYSLIQRWQDQSKKDDNDGNCDDRANYEMCKYSEGVYQVTNVYRITQPTDTLCWVIFALELVFLVLFPFLTMLSLENLDISFIFLLLCFLTFVRKYCNGFLVMKEIGRKAMEESVADNNVSNIAMTSQQYHHQHKKKRSWNVLHRLDLLSRTNGGKSFRLFSSFFLFLGVILLLLLLVGVILVDDTAGRFEGVTMVNGYGYRGEPDLPYPTCQIGKGMEVPGGQNTTLIDYAFLAGLAYVDPSKTQQKLDEFFGPGFASNRNDIVSSFRSSSPSSTNSPVVYLFITFPSQPGYGIISVKGTGNAWDMLADAQLWSAAAFFQIIRFLLPFGEIWNPILDNLIDFVTRLESESINRVSYYKQVADFVSYLKDENRGDEAFDKLVLTGHSLGGGTVIIAGAQTGVPAIALSGPNAKLSRNSFEPPITVEAIDKFTFNVIPQRDPVAMVDDPGILAQKIRCRAPFNSLFACHASTRSLCEIMYTCGSHNRPAICECVDEVHNFPNPEALLPSNITKDFAAICARSKPDSYIQF